LTHDVFSVKPATENVRSDGVDKYFSAIEELGDCIALSYVYIQIYFQAGMLQMKS